MSRDVRDIICDISEMLDIVENECINLIEDRDDSQSELKDIKEKYEDLKEENEALAISWQRLKEKNDVLDEKFGQIQYDAGYEEGFAKGEQSMQEKTNKIIEFCQDTRDVDILQEVFEYLTFYQLFEDIEGTYNRIVEYEEKERYEREIHIGDVVTKDGHNYVVFGFYGNDNNTLDLITEHGVMASLHKDLVTKTGKHYPIDEMLKELGQ